MAKSELIPGTRAWARQIVGFARSEDETRPNLAGWNDEPKRVVASDGYRLAWQQCWNEPRTETVLLEADGVTPFNGAFPDYTQIIHDLESKPAPVRFHLDTRGDWMSTLKRLARLGEKPLVVLDCNGKGLLTVTLKEPLLEASLKIVSGGEPAAFRIGVNALYLWEALNAVKASRLGTGFYARISIYDDNLPIQIDNDNGFYSLTMPVRIDGQFVSVANETTTEGQDLH